MKWDDRFLQLAETIATWSKDPSTKVGAVIVDDSHRVISVGYNGFPKGIDDSPEIYADREYKLNTIIHAETNAILFAQRDLAGCTLYTFPCMPCAHCAALIVQSGIKTVVTVANEGFETRWAESVKITRSLFEQASIAMVVYRDGVLVEI